MTVCELFSHSKNSFCQIDWFHGKTFLIDCHWIFGNEGRLANDWTLKLNEDVFVLFRIVGPIVAILRKCSIQFFYLDLNGFDWIFIVPYFNLKSFFKCFKEDFWLHSLKMCCVNFKQKSETKQNKTHKEKQRDKLRLMWSLIPIAFR